jgi:O-antigen/teichoic acid export membrane protein
VAAAERSKSAVLIVFRRALLFYVALSVLVSVPLWVWARDLVSLIPSVSTAAEGQANVLVRYVAVAFALTNVTLVLAALLQGVDRVDAAYRGQTLGWLLYVPLLAIGLHLGDAAHAVGLAWVGSYGLQAVLLSGSVWSAVRNLSANEGPTPSLIQMLSLGGWWQLSSWADFATFQLPRLAGVVALSPSAFVALDVAMRAAQIVVAPLFAVYPLVLPAAAKAWTLGGADALKAFLDRWVLGGAIALWLFVVSFIPVERPVLAAWTGRPAESFDVWLYSAVLIGVAAHASTGLFSSAQLAVGDVRPVLRYKKQQLVLGLLLISPAVAIGSVATGLALGIALAATALGFDRREMDAFGLRFPTRDSRVWRRLAVVTVVMLVGFSFGASLLKGWIGVSALLILWTGACALGWLWCWRGLAGRETAEASPAHYAGRALRDEPDERMPRHPMQSKD